ncbi:MAG: HAMP domain-containing histidine kinase [Sphingomonas sp.]|nr:MAG: HAMP domain-containing histidine kinase [Sphingomonas sp.]
MTETRQGWQGWLTRAAKLTDATGSANMRQLVTLRWIAVAGQLLTILFVRFVLHFDLPLMPMGLAMAAAVVLNLASMPLYGWQRGPNAQLFCAMLFDVGLLTVQLYLSGGATNPFIELYLLQVVLGAVLLDRWSSWTIVGVTACCFATLTVRYRPLVLPAGYGGSFFELYTIGSLLCFALIATLLVLFMTRITTNLQGRDTHLADLRQQAAEEDHIVRMGLLASGAAHELGTPLASIAVILADWRRMPVLARAPGLLAEIGEMQAEVQRCKRIVTGILLAAGEARGEAPEIVSLHRFLDGIVDDWRGLHPGVEVDYVARVGDNPQIVSDPALKQVIANILDNAAEASPDWIGFRGERSGDHLVLAVRDRGPGFSAERIAGFGKPYQSSKAEPGHGLGLFLAVNVVRKLGGTASVANRDLGGAEVTLTLPLAAIALEEGP